MKKLGVTKLAAIAAGAALVGTAIAPFVSASVSDVQYGDLYNATTGSVNVNVVAGSNAQVSDWQWAGNLAAALARNATTTGTVSVSSTGTGDSVVTVSDKSVDLLVGGTVTVSGGKQYKSDLNSYTTTTYEDWDASGNDTSYVWATNSQLPHLKNETISYKYNNASYTTTQKEYIGARANAQMDITRVAIEDLVLYLSNEGDFNYTTNFSTGVPAYEDVTTAAVKFGDDTNDNVSVYWFGEKYLVNEIDLANSTAAFVKLIKDKAKTSYTVGESFTVEGKNTYAGQTMTVTLTRVVQTSGTATYQSTFQLTDQEGTIVDTVTVSAANYVTFTDTSGSDAIASNTIYVDTVAGTIGTNEGYVEVLVGTSTVDLYEGKGYPYDSSDTDGVYDYKVFMKYDASDSNRVEELAVANSAILFNDSKPIYPTQGALTSTGQATTALTEVDFLNGYATIRFDGFETDESLTTVTVGNNQVTFYDSGDASHTIPFYLELTTSTTGNTFTFDGQTIWYRLDTTNDANEHLFNVSEGSIINGGFALTTAVHYGDIGDGTGFWVIGDTCSGATGQECADANVGTDGNYYMTDWNGHVDINGVRFNAGEFVATAAGNGDFNLWADGNIQFRKTNSTGDVILTRASSTEADYNNSTLFYDDAFKDVNLSAARPMTHPIALPGANSRYFYYNMYVDESTYARVYLFLAGQTIGNTSATSSTATGLVQYSKNIQFNGTMFDGATEPDDVNRSFYLPDKAETGLTVNDNSYATAVFSYDEEDSTGNVYDLNAYIDTSTGKPVVLPNANLTYPTVDLNYGVPGVFTALNGVTFSLRNDTPASYSNMSYTDFGSKISMDADKYTFVSPQNIPQVQFSLLGTGSTTTLANAEELTLAEGETKSTSKGTQIQAVAVNVTTSATGDAGACEATPSTYSMVAPDSQRGRVYSDVDAPATNNVIVGGWAVNTLAPEELRDLLQVEGDTAVVKTASGDIAVAGYTADDTAEAVQSLISRIEGGFS